MNLMKKKLWGVTGGSDYCRPVAEMFENGVDRVTTVQ